MAAFKPCRSFSTIQLIMKWSGRWDLNPRPLGPEPSALPSYATPRHDQRDTNMPGLSSVCKYFLHIFFIRGAFPFTTPPFRALALPANPSILFPPECLCAACHVCPQLPRRAGSAAPARALSYWDTASHGWRIAPGAYTVWAASSSRDLRLTQIFDVK